MRQVGWNIARVGVAVLLIFWLTRSGAIRWEAVGRLVSAWPLTMVALGLFLIDFAVVSCRICILVRPRGFDLSVWDALRLSVVGHLFTQLLSAAGGEAARIFYATKDAPGRRFEVATLLMLDRVLALLALLLLPVATIPLYLDLILGSRALQALLVVAAGGALAIAGGLAIALSVRARNAAPLLWLLARFPLGGYPARFLDTVHAFRGHVGALWLSIGFSLVAHVLSCAVVWLLVAITSQQQPPVATGFLAALGFVANNVPLTPGGIGVGEAAFDSLFSLVGVSGGAAAMLSWRLLLLTLVPPGLVVYLGGRRLLSTQETAT
jgi:uncharacterized membrane protein YbhN (UPF0104 family)